MQASLTELHRKTAKIFDPVIRDGETVVITVRGKVRAQITPIGKKVDLESRHVDRRRILELFRAIGPVELPSRK